MRARLVTSVAWAVLAAGCAAAPLPVAPHGPQGDYQQLYALEGQVASLTAQGKLAGSAAVALDASLMQAKTDLDGGNTAAAEILMATVKTEIP